MKIVSFNVNSIRARLHQIEAVVAAHNPDFLALQETKVTDGDFPAAAVEELGYHAAWHGQKTHYGVAILSRQKPVAVQRGFAGDDDHAQRRMIAGVYPLADGTDLHLVNGYFPQGENRAHPVKFPAKKSFYQAMHSFLAERLRENVPVALVGDMNVAPSDADIGLDADNARRWLRSGKCSFLPEERTWLESLMQLGLVDCHRTVLPQRNDLFSWFDYRSRGFERDPKRGLRIDLILGSRSLAEKCIAAGIDYQIRAMDRPSDHAPVWAEFQTAQCNKGLVGDCQVA